MASSTNKKGGKKKGRAGRSPAHVRYNMELRRDTNKIKKRERHEKKVAKKRARLEKARQAEAILLSSGQAEDSEEARV